MKQCTQCGKIQEQNNVSVCSRCGGSLENISGGNFIPCPSCQAPLAPGANFCNVCGKSLNATESDSSYIEPPYDMYPGPMSDAPKRSNKTVVTLLIVLIVLIIFAIGAGALYFFKNEDAKNTGDDTNGTTVGETEDPDTKDKPSDVVTEEDDKKDKDDEKEKTEETEADEEDEVVEEDEKVKKETKKTDETEDEETTKEKVEKVKETAEEVKEQTKTTEQPKTQTQKEPERVQPAFDPEPVQPKPTAPSVSTLEVSLANYSESFAWAMTYQDVSYIAPYVIPGSPIYNTQAKFVQNGWTEDYVDSYIIGGVTMEDPNTCVITACEIYNVQKPGKSLTRSEQTASYRMKKDSDGYWKVYDFVGSVKSK